MNAPGLKTPDDTEIVEAVSLLHQLATPADAIAKRLHIAPCDVEYIIRHGRLPMRRLTLAWKEADR